MKEGALTLARSSLPAGDEMRSFLQKLALAACGPDGVIELQAAEAAALAVLSARRSRGDDGVGGGGDETVEPGETDGKSEANVGAARIAAATWLVARGGHLTSLVPANGGRVSFSHRIFTHYLVAEVLGAELLQDTPKRYDREWHDVIEMAVDIAPDPEAALRAILLDIGACAPDRALLELSAVLRTHARCPPAAAASAPVPDSPV